MGRFREGLDAMTRRVSRHDIAAWAVHLFTAAGACLAFLALTSLVYGNHRLAWIYLGVAFVIDGVDGAWARRLDVKNVLPRFDGAILDLVVDYLTYVLVPTFFIYQLDLLPSSILVPGCLFILVTSLYVFGNLDLKTPDYYFRGFPALWNVVVFHFYVFDTEPLFNAFVVLILGLLTFLPLKTIHPVRVATWRAISLTVLLTWSVAAVVMVLTHPNPPSYISGLLLAGTAYFVAFSLWRSFLTHKG
jgi:phosphatidylcholine synthase